MIDTALLVFWAVICWFGGMIYSGYWYELIGLKDPKLHGIETYGPRQVLVLVATIFGMILLMAFLSGSFESGTSSPERPLSPGDSQINWPQWVLVLGLGLMMWRFLNQQAALFISKIIEKKWTAFIAGLLSELVFGVLVGLQIFYDYALTNNVFLALLFLIFVPMAFIFRRSGLLTVFLLIMALDLCLVWFSGDGLSQKGGNWYVRTMTSDLMNYWPVPLALRVGPRMLGGGDIFFMTLVVVYAKKTFGKRIAVMAGLATTLPLLILPWAYVIWPSLPAFWPYTIFIAPWGILLILISIFRERRQKSVVIQNADGN